MKTPLQVAIEQYRMQRPRGKLPRPARMLFPTAAERVYRKRLLQLVAGAKIRFVQMSEYMRATRLDEISIPTTLIDKLLQGYEAEVMAMFGVSAKAVAREMTQDVNNHNFEQMRKQFSKLTSMDVLQFTPELADRINMAAKQNAELITNMGADVKNSVSTAVRDGFLKGKRWEEIAGDIENGMNGVGIFGKATSRAALIARDQVATLNGTLTKDRNESLGISLYEWQTAGDARVRDSHRDLNGKVFSWNGIVESGGKTYTEAPNGAFPGSEINCRCVAAPVLLED